MNIYLWLLATVINSNKLIKDSWKRKLRVKKTHHEKLNEHRQLTWNEISTIVLKLTVDYKLPNIHEKNGITEEFPDFINFKL